MNTEFGTYSMKLRSKKSSSSDGESSTNSRQEGTVVSSDLSPPSRGSKKRVSFASDRNHTPNSLIASIIDPISPRSEPLSPCRTRRSARTLASRSPRRPRLKASTVVSPYHTQRPTLLQDASLEFSLEASPFTNKSRRVPKPIDDSGHASEASYSLSILLSGSDHSKALDELNTPFASDDMSGSVLEEVSGIDDFDSCSFEYDEIKVTNDLWDTDCDVSPKNGILSSDDELSYPDELQELKRCNEVLAKKAHATLSQDVLLQNSSPRLQSSTESQSLQSKCKLKSHDLIHPKAREALTIDLCSGNTFDDPDDSESAEDDDVLAVPESYQRGKDPESVSLNKSPRFQYSSLHSLNNLLEAVRLHSDSSGEGG